MAVHLYHCKVCGTEVEVRLIKLGDNSTAPEHPIVPKKDKREHKMQRKYQIGGTIMKW